MFCVLRFLPQRFFLFGHWYHAFDLANLFGLLRLTAISIAFSFLWPGRMVVIMIVHYVDWHYNLYITVGSFVMTFLQNTLVRTVILQAWRLVQAWQRLDIRGSLGAENLRASVLKGAGARGQVGFLR